MVQAKLKYALVILVIIVACALVASSCNQAEPVVKSCSFLKPGTYQLTGKLVEGEDNCLPKQQFYASFSEYGIQMPDAEVTTCHDVVYPEATLCKVSGQTICDNGLILLYDLDFPSEKRAIGTIKVTFPRKHTCTYMVEYSYIYTIADAGVSQ